MIDPLRFGQIDARHATIRDARIKTCKWLLRKAGHVTWLDKTELLDYRGLLQVKRKSAIGKSTLMKFTFGKATNTIKVFVYRVR